MNRTAVSATPPAFKFLTLLFLALTNASIAGAADPDPHGMQAAAVHALLEQGRDEILFIDVRDPIEIQFVGFTDEVDANIPFLLADQTRWNAERGMFLMDRNPRFAAAVHEALAAKGLGKDATIITLCRSGSDRGMPSAAFLRNNGFANASYVIHGFQGDPLEDGPQRGMRLKNGWQNSGLPWSPSLNPEKIHRATAKAGHNWMVVLSSGSNETQAMALILARAEAAQGTPVRILLCDDAGMLAVEGSQAGSDVVQPLGMSPRQLLAGLIQMNAVVELCGIFAQTREIDPSTFIQGVAVASPPGIARQISDPDTKVLSF
jgi:rhodanese-related sulfurtransferase/predicted peroxiredoxin